MLWILTQYSVSTSKVYIWIKMHANSLKTVNINISPIYKISNITSVLSFSVIFLVKLTVKVLKTLDFLLSFLWKLFSYYCCYETITIFNFMKTIFHLVRICISLQTDSHVMYLRDEVRKSKCLLTISLVLYFQEISKWWMEYLYFTIVSFSFSNKLQ